MLGIIATIIAAVKGHGTFAFFVGAWTLVAFIMAASGNYQLAIGPGGIFLIIAICMKKEAKTTETPEQIEKSRENEPVYYCEQCHYIGSYADDKSSIKCPQCATTLKQTVVTRGQWLSMNEEEKNTEKKKWFNAADDTEEGKKLIDAKNSESKTDVESQMKLSVAVAEETTPATQVGKSTICINCGEQLLPEWQFCNKCGHPIKEQKDAAGGEEKQTRTQMIDSDKLYCKSCGAELNPEWEFCIQCGYPVEGSGMETGEETEDDSTAAEKELSRSKDTTQEGTVLNLDLSILPPKLRRAFILVEDEEWEKAETYFESILDEEPENAYAYLGKALIQIKVDSPINIAEKEIQEIRKTKCFSRAVKYADGELKQLLANWQSQGENSFSSE